ncbi:SDR family oxidoreductase [Sphingomonadaceae bacterium OTU29THOMA1]|nr:SDR family oxidoreductase [Sphingomonadaceae bacterium OTU29THOMA1]
MGKQRTVAVVTGGARGIGLSIAEALAGTGSAIAIVDFDGDAAESAAVAISAAYGIRAIAVAADVTVKSQVDAAVDVVTTTLGPIDILVNNAGIVRDKRLVKMDEDDWDAVVATNLKSQFLTCKAVVPGMIERGHGRIVNISSRAWLGGFGQSNYSAAKGGVVSLTRSLAIELAKDGITVNAIAPGIIQTPLFATFAPEVQDRLKKSVPMGRIGSADDVAQAVLFFTKSAASYVTGQLLYVCGGRSLASPSV